MIRAGFIGTGGISGAHLGYLKGREDVKIAAMCDVRREAAERRADEFGGEVFTDFVSMLDETDLNAVWLCTPPRVRREPLVACARRGIPVFCEKPVERDARAGREIARELDALGAKIQVGYCFRCTPAVEELRRLMADDRVHLVQSLYVCRMGLSGSARDWIFDKDKSGGALIDQATHSFDLLRYLFGEVEEVRAQARNPVKPKEPGYTIDETITLMLAFGNGPLATHAHTWVGDAGRNEISMSGEKRFYRLRPADMELVVEDREGSHVFPREKGSHLHDHENARFLQQVHRGDWSSNPSDYADGLKTLRLTLACDKAIERGRIEVRTFG